MRKLRNLLAAGIFLVGLSSISYGATACASLSSGTFTNGDLLVDNVDVCNAGAFTFTNFNVFANAGFTSPTSFDFTVYEQPNGISFGFTNLGSKDILIAYTVTPGLSGMILSASTATVTESICSISYDITTHTDCTFNGGTPLGSGGITGGGTTFISVSPNGSNFVVKDITGGSEVSQTVIPEPMTLSLVGLGLLGLGFSGRRRFTKK